MTWKNMNFQNAKPFVKKIWTFKNLWDYIRIIIKKLFTSATCVFKSYMFEVHYFLFDLISLSFLNLL